MWKAQGEIKLKQPDSFKDMDSDTEPFSRVSVVWC